MKCEKDKDQITLWINQEMTDAERGAFEMHLTTCVECKQELKAIQQVWSLMEEIPVPQVANDMPVRFQTMLENYKESQLGKSNPLKEILDKLRQLWTLQPGIQMAYSTMLVIAGLGLGLLLSNRGANKQQIDALSSQVHEMKEMMLLSLLENPSASERIRGVSYTNEIKGANKEVVDALFTTLDNDQNVNVRLVTLEALTHFANESGVRERLVKSIMLQESPLVQSAMADVMLKLQEKRSLESLKKLLEQKNLDNLVRSKIEQTISRLI